MVRLEDYLNDDELFALTGKRKESSPSLEDMERKFRDDQVSRAVALLRANGYNVSKKNKKRQSKRK